MIPPEFLVVISIAIVGGYLYATDFEQYAIYSIGVFRRVTHEPATIDGHECREHWCDVDEGDGEHRQWFKEIVLFGAPIATYGGGETHYCIDHADAEIQLGLYEETTRTRDRLVWAIVWVAERFATDAEVPEDSEFDAVASDMTRAIDSAVSLFPVVLLILFTAIVISFFRTLAGDPA